jgi:hypothetical protein
LSLFLLSDLASSVLLFYFGTGLVHKNTVKTIIGLYL